MPAGSQFILATHSPILLAYPNATIYQISAAGTLDNVDYDDIDAVLSLNGGQEPRGLHSIGLQVGEHVGEQFGWQAGLQLG